MTSELLCEKCGQVRPVSDFPRVPTRKTSSTCRFCAAARTRAWSVANPDRKKVNARRYHERCPLVARRNKKLSNWARTLLQAAKTSSRTRGHEAPSITEEWILAQPMLCPYLGVPLVPQIRNKALTQPSLDRIDGAKGYTPENTRLTSLAWNQMRNTASLEEALSLVADIREGLLVSHEPESDFE